MLRCVVLCCVLWVVCVRCGVWCVVCDNTSPCVRSIRPRVYQHHALQTICSATFPPFLSCSFFFLLFFYDDAMRVTTTQGQRPPRQQHVDNTTPHPTTQPATTRDTRHDTAPHNKKTKTHTYAHMYMYLYVYMYIWCSCTCRCHFSHFSRKKRSLEHVPSMMCTVPSLGPSTMVECSIPDTSADMTNPHSGKTVNQK